MASEIRVNKINSQTGVGTITLSPTGVDISGITTAATFKVGTGVTASSDGDIFATGVCTATSFSGDGSALTGIDLGAVTGATGDFSIADKIVHTGDTDTLIRFPTADTFSVETGGNEVLRVTSGRDIVTQGLTDHSFNNDGSNTKVLEVSGGGGTGTYGVLNLSGNQNSSAVVGAIKFCNRENSNSSSGSNANSRRLASIDCFADTSDSNGGDDCGGDVGEDDGRVSGSKPDQPKMFHFGVFASYTMFRGSPTSQREFDAGEFATHHTNI